MFSQQKGMKFLLRKAVTERMFDCPMLSSHHSHLNRLIKGKRIDKVDVTNIILFCDDRSF